MIFVFRKAAATNIIIINIMAFHVLLIVQYRLHLLLFLVLIFAAQRIRLYRCGM